MRRTFKYLIESIAALVGISIVLLLLLIWHLNAQPVQATYFTSYVQSGIGYLLPGTEAEIGSTLLVWDNEDRSIALRSDQVTLRDANRNVIASFPAVKIKFSVLAFLRGLMIPVEFGIERPQLFFEHQADGSLTFGGIAGNSTEGTADQTASSTKNLAADLLSELTNAGTLRELAVSQAAVTIHDVPTGQDWKANVPEIRLQRDRDGLKGSARFEVDQPNRKAQLNADYRFYNADKQHEVTLSFNEINPAALFASMQGLLPSAGIVDLPISGKLNVRFDAALSIVAAHAKIEGGSGHINYTDFWEQPRAVKSMRLMADYDKAEHVLHVSNTSLDFEGPVISFEMEGSAPKPETPFDMSYIMNIQLSNLSMDHFTEVWPKIAVPGAREWMAANMSRGLFSHGEIVLQGQLKWDDLANLTMDSGEGKISAKGGTVKYIEGAPAIEGVNAEAKFDLSHMDITVSNGTVGALKLQPSTIKMLDFDKEVQRIDIPVKMLGPGKDVIRIIDAPPLGYAKAVGLKAENIDGLVDGLVDIQLPLLRDVALKDVTIKAEAKLIDFAARKLVPGIDISQGNLAFTLDENGFSVKGPAALNRVPMQISWQQTFNPAKDKPRQTALVTGNVSGDQWTQLGFTFLSKSQGPAATTIHYNDVIGKPSQLSGEINFRAGSLRVDELNWTKPVGTPLMIAFAAELPSGKNVQIKTIDMQGPQVRVKGSATLDSKTTRLLTLDLKPIIVGRTNANLQFAQTADDHGLMRFAADGDAFDISGLTGNKDATPDEQRPREFNVKLNKLWTSEKGLISNILVHAQRDKYGWNEIEMHGLADGSHQLDITLTPQLGNAQRRVLSITCDNFGKLMKGMGFTDTVNEGSFSVKGQSSANDLRAIEGEVKIGSFKVSGLPALARLFSAASPFGFADFVTGNTTFDRLQGNFRWYADTIEFQRMRAIGSVFGVNVEGTIDTSSGNADLHGTLVPFSFFNRVINAIPLVGGLITGGDGEGVLAVNYTIRGDLNDPRVSVNPASLLTPGFLRDLFFKESSDAPKAAN